MLFTNSDVKLGILRECESGAVAKGRNAERPDMTIARPPHAQTTTLLRSVRLMEGAL